MAGDDNLTADELTRELESIAWMIEAEGPRGYDANFELSEARTFRDAAAVIRRLEARVAELEGADRHGTPTPYIPDDDLVEAVRKVMDAMEGRSLAETKAALRDAGLLRLMYEANFEIRRALRPREA